MNPLFFAYMKAYAALIGSTATALLGVFAADTTVGLVLTVVSVIATVVATWAVPNLTLDAAGLDQAEIEAATHSHVEPLVDDGYTGQHEAGR